MFMSKYFPKCPCLLYLDVLSFDPNLPYFFKSTSDEDTFSLPQPMTLRHLASEYLDFMSIPRYVVFMSNFYTVENNSNK